MLDHEIEFYGNVSGFRSEADRHAMVDTFQTARRIYERLAAPPSFPQSGAARIVPSSPRLQYTGSPENGLSDPLWGLDGLVRMFPSKRRAGRFGFRW
jgi:hypothetical protein